MKLVLELVREAKEKKDETSFSIEIQRQRGDLWNTTESKSLPEGQKMELNIPRDARVMLVGPGADMEYVYDPEQKASVRREKQPPVAEEVRKDPAGNPVPPNQQRVGQGQPNTQQPNLQPNRPTSTPTPPGSGIAKPDEPAKPTGVSNQGTAGSPPPSQSPASQGTGSTDTLKKAEDGDKK